MVLLIQPSPLQSTHLTFHINKHTKYPVNHTAEILFQLNNICVISMTAHIIADIALTYPFQSTFQKILPISATQYIRAPFLDIRVLAITKLFFAERYKWS